MTLAAAIADLPLAGIILALTTAMAGAAAFFPALRLGRRARQVLLALLATPMLLAPLWIPAEQALIRAVVAIFAGLMVFKAYDVHVGVERRCRPDLRSYLAWLPNFLSLVLRKAHLEPRPTARRNGIRALRTSAVIAACLLGVAALRQVDWQSYPFALEHMLKAVVLFVLITAGFSLTIQLLRLAGVQARDFTSRLWLAATPADFWNRYNRNVSQFLFEDVYRPARRGRSPARALLIAFAVSAIMHEYVFSIALSRVQGFQTLFFLLQGGAVAATVGWNPKGWKRVAAAVATLVFLLATSVLFFASFHGIVPVYSGEVPAWLPA